MKFLNKKISISYLLATVLFSILVLFVATSIMYERKREVKAQTPVSSNAPETVSRFNSNDYKFAHPLLLSDVGGESEDMQALKNEISSFIEGKTSSGQVESASVYVRRLNDEHWLSVNGTVGYNGGSLLKVPVMMTYFREAEKNQGSFDRKFFINQSDKVPPQTYNDGNIIPGKSYAVKDLVYYMIAKSDNYATLALNEHVNKDEYQDLFHDIGIPKPDMTNRNYTLTCSDYSRFFRVLYTATYLDMEDADHALSILSQTSFQEGLLKELPQGIKVAHKFGEWGEPVPGALHQLHESGIVYLEGNPYLITVMTKGKEVKNLPSVISQVSKMVYEKMKAEKGNS
jgi:beta-lactamase class A